jgi:hypothetical protein
MPRFRTLVLLSLTSSLPGFLLQAQQRMSDGHPNLNGIWEAVNSANWNLEDHPASPGAMWQTGAIASVPAGRSVVEGGEIPYKPEASAKRKENFSKRRTDDPEAKCYMPGIPRANYMPYPFKSFRRTKTFCSCMSSRVPTG